MVVRGEWHEFCEKCGNDPEYSFINGETGETATMAQVFEELQEGS
jgi:hypothetical protein